MHGPHDVMHMHMHVKTRIPNGSNACRKDLVTIFSSAEIQHFITANTRSDYNYREYTYMIYMWFTGSYRLLSG